MKKPQKLGFLDKFSRVLKVAAVAVMFIAGFFAVLVKLKGTVTNLDYLASEVSVLLMLLGVCIIGVDVIRALHKQAVTS